MCSRLPCFPLPITEKTTFSPRNRATEILSALPPLSGTTLLVFFPVSSVFFVSLKAFLASSLCFDVVYQLYSRSEEHTSELQSLMRISYAVFCLKKKIYKTL